MAGCNRDLPPNITIISTVHTVRMAEYYIRKPDSEEANGPYDIAQLQGLLENGKITPDYVYFDETAGQWRAFHDNADLKEELFPEQKRLILKKKEKQANLSSSDDEMEEVSVDQMLANAEGQTEETRHLHDSIKWQERAASLCLPGMAAILLLSAASALLPEFGFIVELYKDREWLRLLSHPLLILAIVDLFLALCCILGATDAFPIIRFRAAIGLGYFGYIYWALGDINASIAVIAASIALFVATLTLSFILTLVCIVAGVAGMGYILVLNIIR